MEPGEVDDWCKRIRSLGAEPFVTEGTDVESYFVSDDCIKFIGSGLNDFSLEDIKSALVENELDDIISSYVNSRIDFERKNGTIGSLDLGKLSAQAARKVNENPLQFMKGKKKLSKIRKIFQERYNIRYDVRQLQGLPVDENLAAIASKYWRKDKPSHPTNEQSAHTRIQLE